MRTIGVISDTHGLLRHEAVSALEGSDLIIHAGDVGDPEILEVLKRIAPVRVVHGNTDHGPLRAQLPHTDVIDLNHPTGDLVADSRGVTGEGPSDPAGVGRSDMAVRSPDEAPSHGPVAYLVHELEHLDLDPAASGFAVVIYGHTHEPAIHSRDGVLYFNPGAAGHRRFHLPVTVGRLTVQGDEVDAEIVHLVVEG